MNAEPLKAASFKPQQLLWIFFCLFALGQLQRLQLGPSLAIYGHDVFIFVWATWQVWHGQVWRRTGQKSQASQHQQVPLTRTLADNIKLLGLSLLGWSIVGLGAATLRGQFDVSTLLYILRLSLYVWFGRELATALGKEELHRRWLVVTLVTASTGLLQYLFVPDTRFLAALGWDDHYYRVIGTFFDPAFTGFILVTGLCLLTPIAWPGSIGMLIVLSVSLAATFSRSSYLATAVGWGTMGVVLMLKKQALSPVVKSLIMCTIIVALTLWLLPKPGGEGVRLERTASIFARTAQIKQTISSLDWQTLLIGQGLFVPQVVTPSTLPNDQQIPYHPRILDNSVLFILMSFGLPGLAGSVLLFWQLSKLLIRHEDTLTLGLVAAWLIHSQFNASLVQPFIVLIVTSCIWSGLIADTRHP